MINTLEPSKALDSVYLAVFNQIKLASHQSGHDMDCRCCLVSWVEGNLFLLRHYHFTPRVREMVPWSSAGPRLQMEY